MDKVTQSMCGREAPKKVRQTMTLDLVIEAEDGAFAEWSAARAHLLMRARTLGRRYLTDEEAATLAPLRAALDAAIAARRAAEAIVRPNAQLRK